MFFLDPHLPYELKHELREIERKLIELRNQLRELEEALRMAREGRVRTAYRIYGGRLAIEIDPNNVEQVIEEEIAITRTSIAVLEKRREELLARLRKHVGE